jgi:hypothetical protein
MRQPSIRQSFIGDDNFMLMRIQEQTFPVLAGELYRAARRRYLKACSMLETRPDPVLCDRVDRMLPGEGYLLPHAYSLMAAYFRLAHDRGAAQMDISFDVGTPKIEDRLRWAWRDFHEKEVAELVDWNDVTMNIIIATTDPTDFGQRTAEAKLFESMLELYSQMTFKDRLKRFGIELPESEYQAWFDAIRQGRKHGLLTGLDRETRNKEGSSLS